MPSDWNEGRRSPTFALDEALFDKPDLTGAGDPLSDSADDVTGSEAFSGTEVLLASSRQLGRAESEWPRPVNSGGGVGAGWSAGWTCSRSWRFEAAEVLVVDVSVMTRFAC